MKEPNTTRVYVKENTLCWIFYNIETGEKIKAADSEVNEKTEYEIPI